MAESDLLSTLAPRWADYLAAHNEDWTAAQIALSQIPAPPWGETARADALAARFAQLGVEALERSPVGNVIGRLGPTRPGPRLVVAAHLDTVFPAETDVTVRRVGTVLHGPGIGDDAAGLALLVALAASHQALQPALPGEVWLVATVGEENIGGLRGALELAERGVGGAPFDAFLTLDAAEPGQVVVAGTHSRNLRVTLHGPGGHAWSAYGVVNPNLVAARIVARVAEYRCPSEPWTTVNCGQFNGGFAPNAIPDRADFHLNLRSADGAEAERLLAWAERAIEDEVAAANAARTGGDPLRVEITRSGRPGGATPLHAPLARAAIAAARAQGWRVTHPASSTDANACLAAGIPALCLYYGTGGGVHTPAEWYETSTRPAAAAAIVGTICGWFDRLAQS